MKPKSPNGWTVVYAKRASTCWICKGKIYKDSKVTKYGARWPHLACAKAHDAAICAEG